MAGRGAQFTALMSPFTRHIVNALCHGQRDPARGADGGRSGQNSRRFTAVFIRYRSGPSPRRVVTPTGSAGDRGGSPATTARSSPNAAPRVCGVKCAFRPLGLGSTHSRAPASGSGCGPKPAFGRAEPDPVRGHPDHGHPRRAGTAPPCRPGSAPPSTSSAGVSSSARALARATMLVMPSPYPGQLVLLARVQLAGGEAAPVQRRPEPVAGPGEVPPGGRRPQTGVDPDRRAPSAPARSRRGWCGPPPRPAPPDPVAGTPARAGGPGRGRPRSGRVARRRSRAVGRRGSASAGRRCPDGGGPVRAMAGPVGGGTGGRSRRGWRGRRGRSRRAVARRVTGCAARRRRPARLTPVR